MAICWALVWMIAIGPPGQDPAADPALAKPRETFKQAVEKARQDLKGQINRKIDLARQTGDRTTVKRLKEDLEALDKNPCPKLSSPYPAHQAAIDKASKTLQADYTRLIRQYTRDGRDHLADLAEKDLKKLLASLKPETPAETPPPDPELAEPNKPWISLTHAPTSTFLCRSGGTASAPGTGMTMELDAECHFQVQQVGPNQVKILHRKTGKWLTPALVAAKTGTPVVLKATMKTEGHQVWQMVPADKGQIRLVHQKTGRPLTVTENGPIVGDLAKPEPANLWKMTPVK